MNEKKMTDNKAVDKTSDPKIVIDDKEYRLDDLTDNAKQQLGSLRATDAEIARLEAMLAMLKTARLAYARAAKEELDKNS
jgi:hypothetical protein